jgi:hypothetical protein
MSRTRNKPEEIVSKLRQVDVLTAQGTPVGKAGALLKLGGDSCFEDSYSHLPKGLLDLGMVAIRRALTRSPYGSCQAAR